MVYKSSSGSSGPSKRHSDHTKHKESDPKESQPANVFKNDGSFLEMFKKMQEQHKNQEESTSSAEVPSVPPVAPVEVNDSSVSQSQKRLPVGAVGKRRGGRILPTGLVKKPKKEEEKPEEPPKDAWSLYMAEVRRYKESSCEEEGKTRPLVK